MAKKTKRIPSPEEAMLHVAKIHAKSDYPDWVYHQTIRFMYDGYPDCAGPVFQKLQKLEGNSLRVRGLRLVLQKEMKDPTPFAGLCPLNRGKPRPAN